MDDHPAPPSWQLLHTLLRASFTLSHVISTLDETIEIYGDADIAAQAYPPHHLHEIRLHLLAARRHLQWRIATALQTFMIQVALQPPPQRP